MQAKLNPFKPGSGLRPRILVGRDTVLKKCRNYIESVRENSNGQAIVLYGLRGVGKTVILNTLVRQEEESHTDTLFTRLELDDNAQSNFRVRIFNEIKANLLKLDTAENVKSLFGRALRLLKSISLNYEGVEMKLDVEEAWGEADSGDFANDLLLVLIELGKAARARNKLVCFFLDEVQNLDKTDLAALLGAIHRIGQDELPLSFLLAGLPNVLSKIPDAKSYGERFRFLEIGKLSHEEARDALSKPAAQSGRPIEPEALSLLVEVSGGYPYFIQQYGLFAWDQADGNPGRIINLADVNKAIPHAQEELDKGFYGSRFVRSTPQEREFMKCMAAQQASPYSMADINNCLNRKANQTSPLRANLIDKGFIYAVADGQIDFTVPLFGGFLRRQAAAEQARYPARPVL